ncbi:redoxin family protein [Dankookia sp. GCM10030260]|uniref:redoxin family protein n=1 Tax=Dankookia sp. GCM10030260 TaxID=3273390 RepID=UPI0036235196
MPSRRRIIAAAALLPTSVARAQPAPEFAGLDGWLNSPVPLSIAGLRGKVVLVDFWTYSCINCRRTFRYLNRWQAEYGAAGLQVIGIHTPEFGFERQRHNVESAVREFGLRYPVGQDNRFETWRAWNNRAWPAFYLLDRDGRIVLLREGEGHAREMEAAIRGLLGLPPRTTPAPAGDDPDLSRIASPEIYFGAQHPTPQARAQSPRPGAATYGFGPAAALRLNQYELDGTWLREAEALSLQSPRGGLRLRFSAAKLHLVAGATREVPIRVSIDGGAPVASSIGRPTLYTLLDGEAYGEHRLEFTAEQPGLSLFSVTFG